MNHNSVSELIERLRQQLNQTADQADNLTHQKVVELSQRLDILIMHAQRMKAVPLKKSRTEKRIGKESTLCRFLSSWTRHKRGRFKMRTAKSAEMTSKLFSAEARQLLK